MLIYICIYDLFIYQIYQNSESRPRAIRRRVSSLVFDAVEVELFFQEMWHSPKILEDHWDSLQFSIDKMLKSIPY